MKKLRLKDYLKDNNITERELSRRLGTTVQYINGVCNGRLVISHKRLIEIAGVLGCKWTDIVTDGYVSDLRDKLGVKELIAV